MKIKIKVWGIILNIKLNQNDISVAAIKLRIPPDVE